ncbi:hypothetical protein SLS62_001801 [Diatrype stigma]|uniref:Major facilitator superfamily (MFS) profile domain-containing protein n=1 Tax=Diatrype stigma TaxID=117547 RepID=A0AAN9UXL4_9PEZI
MATRQTRQAEVAVATEAETAPLLGSNGFPANGTAQAQPGATNGTFAALDEPENSRDTTGAENDQAGGAGESDEDQEPKVKMAALLPGLAIGIFLVAMDQTLTIAAYGRMGSDLGALHSTSWIATSYFLTLTAFQPLYGRLSDIFGRKACLLFAYSVFGLGCLGCGLARDIVQLCVARAVAGVGGGGMNAVISILVTDLVSLRDRGVWQGYINIVYAAGVAAGAPIGGSMADSIGWRWAFIGQFPIAVAAWLAVYFVLHMPKVDHAHWTEKLARIDFLGALTLVAAVFLLLFGLDNGANEGWSQAVTVGPLAGAPVLFAAFVFVEMRVASHPFAPGHVIFHGPLLAAYGANFFGIAVHMAVTFFIALFFQAAVGLSAFRSGLLFLPGTVASLAGALGGGVILKRTGKYYKLTLIALACALFSVVLLVAFTGAAVQSVIGVVVGLMILSLGSGTGVSISTATMQQVLRVKLAQELNNGDRAREIEEGVRQSLDYIRHLDPDVAAIVRKCYAVATQFAFAPVAVLSVLSLISAAFIMEKKLDSK